MSWSDAKNLAKKIPIKSLLDHYGVQPVKASGHQLWYRAPYREEADPSFRVDLRYNRYKDFGLPHEHKGGDPIDLAQKLYPEKSFKDLVLWLVEQFSGGSGSPIKPQTTGARIIGTPPDKAYEIADNPTFKIISLTRIFSKPLLDYIQERGITPALAHQWLKQAYYENTKIGKNFYALAMKNDSGGLEARNKYFKGNIKAPKDIRYIRNDPMSTTPVIHIFEGYFDFLTYLELENSKTPPSDAIILNSTNNYQKAIEHILEGNYEQTALWFDNEQPGSHAEEGVQFITEEFKKLPLQTGTMNHLYAGYKDLNEWYVKTNASHNYVFEPAILSA